MQGRLRIGRKERHADINVGLREILRRLDEIPFA
jgi:hypothetical protein